MRYLYKRVPDEELQSHLKMVEEVVNSVYFIMIDLLFCGLFLSIFTWSVHHSIKISIFIFIGFYLFGVSIYLLLKKWLKDEIQ
jgi:hypothetical protein